MKHLLLLVLLAGPLQAQRVNWVDHAMLITSSALIVADWSTTMDALKRDRREGYRETNPLLGEHPSPAYATALIGAGFVMNVAVVKIRNVTVRRLIWAAVIAVEAEAVHHNLQLGLRFQLP